MATTDLHMHLTSFDYCAGLPDPSVGLTRTASLIRAARAEAQASGALSLLFDNGDALIGTPLGETTAPVHPMMRAARVLGYDALLVDDKIANVSSEDLVTGVGSLVS